MIRRLSILAAAAALAASAAPAVAGAVAPPPPRADVIHNAGPSPIAAHVASHTEGPVSLAEEVTESL